VVEETLMSAYLSSLVAERMDSCELGLAVKDLQGRMSGIGAPQESKVIPNVKISSSRGFKVARTMR
jgi:hypothetical protein